VSCAPTARFLARNHSPAHKHSHSLSTRCRNIEVLAPECLVPDFSFYQKFGAVLSLPFAVFAVFLVFNGCRYVVVRFFFKQRGFKRHLHNMAGSISVALLLVFLFYLNETKLVFVSGIGHVLGTGIALSWL